MTTKEIKSKFISLWTISPEYAPQTILEYLKELEGKTADQIKLAKDLRGHSQRGQRSAGKVGQMAGNRPI